MTPRTDGQAARFARIAWIACAIALPVRLAAETEASPRAQIERLDQALLESMRGAATQDLRSRDQLLAPVVAATYDLSFMARLSLGRHWSGLNTEQQARWARAFARLLSATYTSNFSSYDGDSFVVDAEQPAAQGTVTVTTRLVSPGEEDVRLDYRMRKTAEGWRVVDAYADGGISELALRRAEYTATFEREGFAALIAQVERKTEALLTPAR